MTALWTGTLSQFLFNGGGGKINDGYSSLIWDGGGDNADVSSRPPRLLCTDVTLVRGFYIKSMYFLDPELFSGFGSLLVHIWRKLFCYQSWACIIFFRVNGLLPACTRRNCYWQSNLLMMTFYSIKLAYLRNFRVSRDWQREEAVTWTVLSRLKLLRGCQVRSWSMEI